MKARLLLTALPPQEVTLEKAEDLDLGGGGCGCGCGCVSLQRMKNERGIILHHPKQATVKGVPTASRTFIVKSGMIPTTARVLTVFTEQTMKASVKQ